MDDRQHSALVALGATLLTLGGGALVAFFLLTERKVRWWEWGLAWLAIAIGVGLILYLVFGSRSPRSDATKPPIFGLENVEGFKSENLDVDREWKGQVLEAKGAQNITFRNTRLSVAPLPVPPPDPPTRHDDRAELAAECCKLVSELRGLQMQSAARMFATERPKSMDPEQEKRARDADFEEASQDHDRMMLTFHTKYQQPVSRFVHKAWENGCWHPSLQNLANDTNLNGGGLTGLVNYLEDLCESLRRLIDPART